MKTQFVQYSLLTLLTATAFFIAKPAAADTEDDLHITHGPILGRVRPHGIGVWARTSRDTQFAVRYGTAADKLDTVSPPVRTRLENDNTGWVDLTGL
ncbi:MAG: alkaline phosphatase, partial [Pirellulales bacterium]